MHFKNFEGKPERESPKRTISTTGGLGLSQMVSKPDTGRCANERVEPWRWWTQGGVPARTLSLKGGWIGGLTSIGEGNKCHQGRWAPKGGGL